MLFRGRRCISDVFFFFFCFTRERPPNSRLRLLFRRADGSRRCGIFLISLLWTCALSSALAIFPSACFRQGFSFPTEFLLQYHFFVRRLFVFRTRLLCSSNFRLCFCHGFGFATYLLFQSCLFSQKISYFLFILLLFLALGFHL